MRKQTLLYALASLLAASLPGLPVAAQSPAKGKVSENLMSLAKPNERGGLAQARAASPFRMSDALQTAGGYVVIEAVATTPDARQLLADLQARGLRDGAAYGAMVSGRFPISQLAGLETVASLRQARPAYKPTRNVGRVTSQGDRALRADVARTRFGVSGQGVRVGILSDSYNLLGGAAAGVASDDLPDSVQVLLDLPADGIDEGRAMAEIVHDVAPGAAIAFHTAFLGQASFAQGIEALQAAGSQVIVDDIIYFAEPFFQNGIVAQAAERVVGRGSTYFSSAGNQGQQSYEAPFRNSGTQLPGIGGVAHSFAPGDIRQSLTIPAGGSLTLALQWDDPSFSASGTRGAATDLDLYVFAGGNLIAQSDDNNLGGDPFEFIGLTNNGTTPGTVEIVIVKFAGPDPRRIKYVNFGSRPSALEYDTQSSTLVGHANARRVVAVAAAPYFNTPLFNPATPVPVVEGFSALGGTPILFDDQGRRLGAPRFFNKPEITGPDGANTTFFPPFPGADFEGDGFPNFFGTSASAPHVAAVAALMQEAAQGFLTPSLVRLLLQTTAVDMDNPLTPGFDRGFDPKTGFGFVQADAVLARLRPAVPQHRTDALAVSLFPNPANGPVTFTAKTPANQAYVLTVLDHMGREVFRHASSDAQPIVHDFSRLPRGPYIAKVQTGTAVKTQLLMLE